MSSAVANPVFKTNSFTLPTRGLGLYNHQFLIFSAFLVIDNRDNSNVSSQDSEEKKMKGQARLLGECELNLDPYKTQLTEISNDGVKATLKFVRTQDGREIVVGRFAANLKLVVSSKM